ncbi:unnamed protein product [Lathyrus sativus]|nr:unnamed protein product [Lathyrus sativus]
MKVILSQWLRRWQMKKVVKARDDARVLWKKITIHGGEKDKFILLNLGFRFGDLLRDCSCVCCEFFPFHLQFLCQHKQKQVKEYNVSKINSRSRGSCRGFVTAREGVIEDVEFA